jgi:hypothetical protein
VTAATVGLEKRLRLAGILLIFGLLVEGTCLLWARPLAFILLVCGGGLLCATGIVVFLYSLVSAGGARPEP